MRLPLRPEIIRAVLVTSGGRWRDVEFHAAIGSTNDRAGELLRRYAETRGDAPAREPSPYAGERAPADSPLWRVVLTDHQTGGRGRLGRTWEVPDRAAVAVSVTVPAPEPAVVGWLPLLTGLALSRAIDEVTRAAGTPLTTRLKWPNDVLVAEDGDRKVSGILCELVQLAPRETGNAVVIGAGTNVDQGRDELPVDSATSLAAAGATVRREDLVIAYLTHLGELLDPAGTGTVTIDVAGGRAAYGRACSTFGAEVRVHLPTGEIAQGQATGVDRTGGLVVATTRGVRTFAAGDVVHVRGALGGLA